MKIARTTALFYCLLFVSACNQEIQSTKGDSRSEKKIDTGSNPAPGGTTQTNTSAKHLLEPPADSVFVSSCTKKLKVDGSLAQSDQSLSTSGKAAADVVRSLAGNGKFTYCAERFIAASAGDAAKAMFIEDMSGSCIANETSSEARFSLSERCPPHKRESKASNEVVPHPMVSHSPWLTEAQSM